MRRRFWSFIAGAIGLISPALGAVTTPTFQGLGFLPNGTFSNSAGTSRNGQFVVGGAETSAGHYLTYIWNQSSGMASLGEWPGSATQGGPWSVSDDGSVVVGEYFAPVNTAFRWTAATGIQPLGSLDGQSFNRAFAVSADGLVIYGDAESNSGNQAFRWTQATGMVGLGYPTGYVLSSAKATSADGSVVVGFAQKTSGQSAFRWTAADGFQILPGTGSAVSISADGSTVVGETDDRNGQAYRWTAATGIQVLGVLPGGSIAYANTVSADGSIIAGDSNTSSGVQTGFVWDAVHGMRDIGSVLNSYNLDISGWTFEDAWVAGDGITFSGTGIDPQGLQEAWVATVPEPGLPVILLVISGILLMRGRRFTASNYFRG